MSLFEIVCVVWMVWVGRLQMENSSERSCLVKRLILRSEEYWGKIV